MKYTFFFLAFVAFSFGCDPVDTDTLPDEAIELDNTAWNYSQKYSLVRSGGTPGHRDIYVKIDGEDGSFLYLTLPQENLDSIPSMPYEVIGTGAYYSNSSLPTDWPLVGQAKIQLLGLNVFTHQLRLTFDVVVNDVVKVGHGNVGKHFSSGIISAIDFKEVNTFATFIDSDIKKNQDEWHVIEKGSNMVCGELSSFFYSDAVLPVSSSIWLNIPWGLALGTYQIDSTNTFPVIYEDGNGQWILESAELTLEENSFRDAKQKVRFKGVFHHPKFPDQKFEVTDGRFEVSFQN